MLKQSKQLGEQQANCLLTPNAEDKIFPFLKKIASVLNDMREFLGLFCRSSK